MPRAATTTDAFTAVAEPNRRRLLELLAPGELAVGDLVRMAGLAQPQVSKHLGVLRAVGAVEVRELGRRRLYRVNGEALRPIHEWVSGFEQAWSDRFEALDAVISDLKRKEQDE